VLLATNESSCVVSLMTLSTTAEQHFTERNKQINLIIKMFTDDCIQFHNTAEDTDTMREKTEPDDMMNAILMELFSSSEEEDNDTQWGRSRKGRSPNKDRDFAAVHAKLIKDDFNGACFSLQ
jgi:hypothetical protein